MLSLPDIAEKHARILGEVAEFGLNLARKLHDQAMAAEDPAVTADLAKAFHAVSRTLRQTLLLEARVAREAAGMAEDGRKVEESRVDAAVSRRFQQISQTLDQVIVATYDHEDDGQRVYEEAMERLYEDSLSPDFLDLPIKDQIDRLCAEFGLPPPERPVERPAERPGDPPVVGRLVPAGFAADPDRANGHDSS